MWKVIKEDCTLKPTLFIIDAEEQLAAMRCPESSDPVAHYTEIKAHLDLMDMRYQNLTAMGSTIGDAKLCTLILGSLPESYRSLVQTVSSQRELSNTIPKKASLFKLILNEANHRMIVAGRGNRSESAMFAKGKSKRGKSHKRKPDGNC